MADYTALTEAGTALVELLRENLTPEPLSNRELINLCSPHESENNQLTLYLYHIEEKRESAEDAARAAEAAAAAEEAGDDEEDE